VTTPHFGVDCGCLRWIVKAACGTSRGSQRDCPPRAPLRSDELRACDVRDTVQWFEDIDTGTTLHRSGFIALQAAPCAGTGKTVVVWKLDRLARSMQEGLHTLSTWWEAGVRVVSVTQPSDLSGTRGRLVAISEIELQHIKERQAAGIALAQQ
jgi:DNA invertase Pin-like site-specific DNA recombinase